jgi:glycosyltransferase involved in cell wall biosynthesis
MWAIADIALCTSDSEGMPLSLIEAQMVGIPVVSTNVGSIDEIVSDHVTGYLGMTVAELLDGFEWVRENKKQFVKKNTLKRKIRSFALKKFKIETMAKSHRELYSKLGV